MAAAGGRDGEGLVGCVYFGYIDSVAEDVENLIIEMLRSLRNELRDFRKQHHEDIADLKARMSSLEVAMVAVRRDVNRGEEVDTRQQVSLDRIVERIERIERCLDLADAG